MQNRVVLSAGNIAHYHHAALALQGAGYLREYFCVFHGKNDLGALQRFLPAALRTRLDGKALPGLDHARIRAFPAPYLVAQLLRRVGVTGQARTDALFGAWYDRVTLRHANDAAVFHFVNGMGLQTARRAKENGSLVICDLRAEHVDRQEETLRLEYERLCLPYRSMRSLYRKRLLAEYALADFLIAPSSYVADTMTRSGISPEKICIVPYGVNLPRIPAPSSRRGSDGTKHPFRILFVGQVIPRKGIHHLVQAFVNLQLPNSELVIVGRGEPAYQKLLTELVMPGRNVRFVGQLPQRELKGYYLDSDVFVLPSLSEGSALVVYEAMSAGLPVITTPNAGSIIRDGVEGFIVPACNPDALQDKILYLHRDMEARLNMGNSAQERTREFTWERYRNRLLKVYERILTTMED